MEDIALNIKIKKLEFYKTVKLDDQNLTKVCVEGIVEGRRTRGRPRRRWVDGVKFWTGSTSVAEANKKIMSTGNIKDIIADKHEVA